MEWVQRVRKTDLSRNTSEIIRAVMRGQTALIESHGKAEAAIIDIVDYLILRAALRYHKDQPSVAVSGGLPDEALAALHDPQSRYDLALAHYLSGAISLARAAELLQLPALDLRVRFLRLDVPLRLGTESVEDAQDEAQIALTTGRRSNP